MRRRLELLEPGRHNGALGARVQTLAVHAGTLIDNMDKAELALDGILLASVRHSPQPVQQNQDVVGDKRAADPRRALVTRDVRIQLFPKKLEGLRLATPAMRWPTSQRLLAHRGRKVTNEVEIRVLAIAATGIREDRSS